MRNQIAAANLKQTKGALQKLGIPFCLFLGTALGAWRDHDFCPGDIDDIDLAVHADHYARKDQIIEAMERIGFTAHEYEDPNAIAHEIAFQKGYGDWRSKVDIFFLVPKGDQMIWSFYDTPAQNKSIDGYHFLAYQRVNFYGTTYNVPHNIETYLEKNYGKDWRTPIHRDNWDWRKDNRCEKL